MSRLTNRHTMYLSINPYNPEKRKIAKVIDCLQNGGIIIYPTDTVYGLACAISKPRAMERLCRLKRISPKKANLTFICNNLSQLAQYAIQMDNPTFKLLKHTLPGPYTYILKANNKVPKLFKNNKKTIGFRIPDNVIAQTIVQEMGVPILSSSLKKDDDFIQYPTEPYEIKTSFGKLVDIIIDGGIGGYTPSTVIDCTGYEPQLIRAGAGAWDYL